VMANVDRIAEAIPGCHVCLVHHLNAGGTKLRGHTSVYAGVDQVILVTEDEETKIRTATLDKQKDEQDGDQIRFELMRIEMGHRVIDGKPITSCVALPVGGKQELRVAGKGPGRTTMLSQSQTLILRALKNALEEHGEPTPPALKLPKSITTVVNAKHWKAAYMALTSDTKDNAINQAMKRASERFINIGLIGRINPWVWLTGRAVADAVPYQGNMDAGPPVTDDLDFSPR
jgi:hypothetical protein